MASDTVTFGIAMPEELKAELEAWAKAEERSVSWIIRKLIEGEKSRRMKQLALLPSPTPSQGEGSPVDEMRRNGAVELVPIVN